jgi:hypothetical protein
MRPRERSRGRSRRASRGADGASLRPRPSARRTSTARPKRRLRPWSRSLHKGLVVPREGRMAGGGTSACLAVWPWPSCTTAGDGQTGQRQERGAPRCRAFPQGDGREQLSPTNRRDWFRSLLDGDDGARSSPADRGRPICLSMRRPSPGLTRARFSRDRPFDHRGRKGGGLYEPFSLNPLAVDVTPWLLAPVATRLHRECSVAVASWRSQSGASGLAGTSERLQAIGPSGAAS